MTAPDHRYISVTTDAMRHPDPPLDEQGRPVISRHVDVVAAANAPDTYSSSVSRHLQVPTDSTGTPIGRPETCWIPFSAPTGWRLSSR